MGGGENPFMDEPFQGYPHLLDEETGEFPRSRRDRRAEGGVEEPAIAGRRPGEAGDASRRKVIVGAVLHRAVVQRCGRRTNRGVITCRVMRVHFGVTMAEMHHEHSDTPNCIWLVRISRWGGAAYWDRLLQPIHYLFDTIKSILAL